MTSPTPARPAPRHRYFVSFATRHGFGCIEMALALPVAGISDIEVMARLAAQKAGEPSVIVLYYAPLPDTTEGA